MTTKLLTHPDDLGVTVVLDDGTKVFWHEERPGAAKCAVPAARSSAFRRGRLIRPSNNVNGSGRTAAHMSKLKCLGPTCGNGKSHGSGRRKTGMRS